MKRLLVLAAAPLALGGVAYAQLSYVRPSDLASVLPSGAASTSGLMYASTCAVTINTATPTSTFCPVATDGSSATRRTYPANSLTIGKTFLLQGGGRYSVPAANLNTADILIKIGSATVMSLTTPAAPVGTNQGVVFTAICSVRTSTTIACQGIFNFVVAGATGGPAPFDQTGTFDPTVANVVDVTGDWNTNAAALTTQSTVVTQAVLIALN